MTPEHDLEPVDGATRDDDDAIARADALLAQRRSPTAAPSASSHEGAGLDDAVGAEERQGAAPGVACERLDDVLREVEAVGDLPAAVDERGAQGELER